MMWQTEILLPVSFRQYSKAPASRDRTRVTVGVARRIGLLLACERVKKRGRRTPNTAEQHRRSSDGPVVDSIAAGAQAILLCRCTVTLAL